MIHIKRVYDPIQADEGTRILVDRLWPRGLTKEKAKIDIWMKEIAPSNELRKLYHDQEIDWQEFKKRYFAELSEKLEQLQVLRDHIKLEKVTFVFSSKNIENNNATALKEFLEK